MCTHLNLVDLDCAWSLVQLLSRSVAHFFGKALF